MGERPKCSLNSSLLKERTREVLRAKVERLIGHLCQLIDITLSKSKCFIFMTGGSLTTWSKVPTEFRLLRSHRHWKRGCYPP